MPVLSLVQNYQGNQKIEPCSQQPTPTPKLLGAIVKPWDGSSVLVLHNGVLQRKSIAMDSLRKQWKVIAENGKFPTSYGNWPKDIADINHPNNTNDTMIVAIDDPSEIAFIRANQLTIISHTIVKEYDSPTEEDKVKVIMAGCTALPVKLEKSTLTISLPHANTELTLAIYNRIGYLCSKYKTEIRHLYEEPRTIILVPTKYSWDEIYQSLS